MTPPARPALRTHVYLDVDGVINAVNTDPPPWGWTDSAWTTDPQGVLYSPSLVSELNRLAALPGVFFFWLTTWDERAPGLLAPAIGLDGANWEVVGTDLHYARDITGWWKVPAIAEHAMSADVIVWLDDDIAADLEAMNWVRAQTKPLHVVSPNCHVGLTRAEVRELRDFLESMQG